MHFGDGWPISSGLAETDAHGLNLLGCPNLERPGPFDSLAGGRSPFLV